MAVYLSLATEGIGNIFSPLTLFHELDIPDLENPVGLRCIDPPVFAQVRLLI
jgi:hypothetical protein